ncbi:hypothetical protein [Massilia sp. erpn]|uniref:hypothetical protein n=1 Tax=Massilia sp. erpn TaxID=2738142 RepID=UPI002101F3E5|nr:hypothetical protein [Massilia sp. erpn]UTY60485.1 hypothetical protein HPQ68_26795 [Massilia sp. erpn]
MVAPLLPQQLKEALARGSQDELDEFHRLVEKSCLEEVRPQIMNVHDKERLRELRDKLFPQRAVSAQPKRSAPG